MIAIDLCKQQVLDADPRAIQQIRFTVNLNREDNTTMLFIIEEGKEIPWTSQKSLRLFTSKYCKCVIE